MTESAQFADFSSAQDWFFLIAAFFCVTCAALAAGMILFLLFWLLLPFGLKLSFLCHL